MLLNEQRRRVLLLSGKGGVGKSTVAAAAAVALARRGERTLLVSTDPAHSISDLVGRGPRRWPPGVDVAELDADALADAHVAGVREAVRGAVEPHLERAVHRHLDLARRSPGTMEAAVFERMAELLRSCPEPYDRIVVDTAPSGHTLRLLRLPELLTDWIEGVARQRRRTGRLDRMAATLVGQAPVEEQDPLLARLQQRRALLTQALERLRDDAAIWLVLTPERLAVEETDRTAAALRAAGLPVAGLVVNRVLPPEADGAFLATSRIQQQAQLAELGRRFRGLPAAVLALRPAEIAGGDDLASLGAELAAGGVLEGRLDRGHGRGCGPSRAPGAEAAGSDHPG